MEQWIFNREHHQYGATVNGTLSSIDLGNWQYDYLLLIADIAGSLLRAWYFWRHCSPGVMWEEQ